MVMSVLWTRLGETGKDWRYVYKVRFFLTFFLQYLEDNYSLLFWCNPRVFSLRTVTGGY